ncbi:uncharacterized protein PG998_014302 [Apiospora kogelbergensis]|uniref:uncharacterized protein n=1 Tax=Apiospora kogelbergensis TaxID=1337665 RepID=UPI00313113D8
MVPSMIIGEFSYSRNRLRSFGGVDTVAFAQIDSVYEAKQPKKEQGCGEEGNGLSNSYHGAHLDRISLQAAESDAIMKFQKDNDVSMFKSRGNETVEGQGTQFCISTLAFGQFIDKANMKYYVNIDDHFPGEDDINDLIPVNDTMLAKFGLSAKSWMKLLNAHNPTIDNMKFKKEDEKYGTEPLVTNNQDPLTMPSLVDIKRAFGLVDESEEEAD